METLFPEINEQDRMRDVLISAYANQLLMRPPVRSLDADKPDRIQQASILAKRDVDRLLLAVEELGHSLTLFEKVASIPAIIRLPEKPAKMERRKRLVPLDIKSELQDRLPVDQLYSYTAYDGSPAHCRRRIMKGDQNVCVIFQDMPSGGKSVMNSIAKLAGMACEELAMFPADVAFFDHTLPRAGQPEKWGLVVFETETTDKLDGARWIYCDAPTMRKFTGREMYGQVLSAPSEMVTVEDEV